MQRWERHWWESTEITEVMLVVETEPTVWVDPTLVDDRPKRRPRGTTVPPPSCVGAYCALDGSDD
jgi:hypothetical protein